VRRAALRFVVATLSAALAYYGFSFWQVWSTGRIDQVRSVDVIVVLGAAQYDGRPSPQLAGRLDHVVELWSLEAAPLVVVAGGKQQGDRFTEAEASELDVETVLLRDTSAADAGLPHWPAPVFVVRYLMPNCLLYQACATAVFGLWLPAGDTPSFL